MRLLLEIVSGPQLGKKVVVEEDHVVRVGRSPKCEVALDDNFLSGKHFAVECNAKGCRVKDLNSRNGTKLNGELIIDAALKSGDRLFAGHTDFTVRLAKAESVQTSSSRRA